MLVQTKEYIVLRFFLCLTDSPGLLQRQTELLVQNSALREHHLMDLNSMAVKYQKSEDMVSSLAVYSILFDKVLRLNVTHPELYVCYCNAATAALKSAMHDDALKYAERSKFLAERSLRRNAKASAAYIKAFLRKGEALVGLQRFREAVGCFNEALKLDPFNIELKSGLQKAGQLIMKELAEGKSTEHKSITYPEPSQRITYHPHSAPLHRIRTDNMLPLQLLTPFQAENDHHIKDTYNYLTVQADIRMPLRHIDIVQDEMLQNAWAGAISEAVSKIATENGLDCRVLDLGAGAGLHTALALESGASHVTAVERWLYLALTAQETLKKTAFDDSKFKVVYKRPTDLLIKEDVPVCCNLVLANMFDEGFLTSGIIPSLRHCLQMNLLTQDAIILPSSATVYVQAVEIRTTDVAGCDMRAANLYRWHPAYSAGVPFDPSSIIPLSDPVEAWYFNLGTPPEKNDTKTLDITFTRDGRCNAIKFWFKLHLFGDTFVSTQELVCMKPAVQYLAGELSVQEGSVLPILATHNTVRMRFDIEEAEYIHLYKADASFPQRHFSMLADTGRALAYKRALERTISKRKAIDHEAHVLDIGAGTGLLSILAAKAGATSVVGCEIHEPLCDVARKAVAANKVPGCVSIVHRDVGLLQRGREIRPLGVNVVVADVFDAGLLGDGCMALLEMAKRSVVQPGASVVPAAASVYCVGIETETGTVQGIDMNSLDTYRWQTGYQAVRASQLNHRILTRPCRAAEFFFDGTQTAKGRESILKLETIESGTLNAVLFWFDLVLDEADTITNAPPGYGQNGVALADVVVPVQEDPIPEEEDEHYWGQALQYLDRAVSVEPGKKVMVLTRREGNTLKFSLRQSIGDWVPKAPWRIEWGGGSSVENPHFQRVHYCELLVRDFLMRCKSNRFPSIEKDMKMALAHCGSLLLDPAALQEVYHEMVVLERLHTMPEFSPGASLEAITRLPLSFH